MPLTPKNRKEEWLEGLVEHETTLTPKNRCETWMKEIIDASGTGGGGADIGLGITGASAGEYAKIKTVDTDGVPTAWESGTGGMGVLVCNLDINTLTLDKTWKEIYDAPFSVIHAVEEEGLKTVALIYEFGVYEGEYYVRAASGNADGATITFYTEYFVTNNENGYPVISE